MIKYLEDFLQKLFIDPFTSSVFIDDLQCSLENKGMLYRYKDNELLRTVEQQKSLQLSLGHLCSSAVFGEINDFLWQVDVQKQHFIFVRKVKNYADTGVLVSLNIMTSTAALEIIDQIIQAKHLIVHSASLAAAEFCAAAFALECSRIFRTFSFENFATIGNSARSQFFISSLKAQQNLKESLLHAQSLKADYCYIAGFSLLREAENEDSSDLYLPIIGACRSYQVQQIRKHKKFKNSVCIAVYINYAGELEVQLETLPKNRNQLTESSREPSIDSKIVQKNLQENLDLPPIQLAEPPPGDWSMHLDVAPGWEMEESAFAKTLEEKRDEAKEFVADLGKHRIEKTDIDKSKLLRKGTGGLSFAAPEMIIDAFERS